MIDYNKLLDEQNQITKSLLSKELSVPSAPNDIYSELAGGLEKPAPAREPIKQYFRGKFSREFAPKTALANYRLNIGRQQTLYNYYFNLAKQSGMSVLEADQFARQKTALESQNQFIAEQRAKDRASQNRIETGAENFANQGLNIETQNYYDQNLPQYGVGQALAQSFGGIAGTLGGYALYKGLTREKQAKTTFQPNQTFTQGTQSIYGPEQNLGYYPQYPNRAY